MKTVSSKQSAESSQQQAVMPEAGSSKQRAASSSCSQLTAHLETQLTAHLETQLTAHSEKKEKTMSDIILTDKPSGSWNVDPVTGVWTPADEATKERYGKDATYSQNALTDKKEASND